jgi:hypothetical protein
MKREVGKRKPDAASRELEKLHHALIALYDELTETAACIAFFCDGICGVLAEHPTDVDPTTQTGIRFTSIALKHRNDNHAAALRSACNKLHGIRSHGR